jgi:phosphoglycolate phosphatase-like HAD superfamily hydrolase
MTEAQNRKPDPQLCFQLAKALGVSIEDLLGIGDAAQRAKRGPKSQLERQLEAVATLPRNEQQKILAVVEAMIAHHTTR